MAATAVDQRYARALAVVVLAPGSGVRPEEAVSKLRLVADAMASSSDLRHVMMSPAIAASRKRAAIGKLVEPLGLNHQLRNFLFVLIDNRRIGHLASIVDAFEQVVDESLGFVRADVASAQELSPDQRRKLEEQIARITGKRARVRYRVDAALVGGVVARVGSFVYDGSVRGQLDRLRQRLAGR
jgi:F-type H+-transporting ATPase subunit delta